MSQVILFISLLLVPQTTQSHQVVQQNCNEDATLWCPVLGDMDFFSFTWYKDQIPIIRKRKNLTQYSNSSRDVEFGENLTLVLPRVKPADSGNYMCSIRANIGQKNKEGYVFLRVNDSECVTQIEPTGVATTLNSTHSSLLYQVKEFPFLWSLAGYLTVALAKIILSLFSIQVIQVVSLRRQMNRLRS